MANQMKIIVVGLTGSGKSTTSNSLLNRSGEMIKFQTPFTTSDGTAGCTLHFQQEKTENLTILDTVGFGDPQFNPFEIFVEFKNALKETENKVTHIIYVVRKGRFTKELVEFLKSVQEKVFKNKCFNNSFVLFTDAPKGWVEKQADQFVDKAVQNCNRRYYEYSLRFDRDDDDENGKKKNIEKRQKVIEQFLAYMDGLIFDEIDLSHIQTAEFEEEYKNEILPHMLKILTDMLGEATPIEEQRSSLTQQRGQLEMLRNTFERRGNAVPEQTDEMIIENNCSSTTDLIIDKAVDFGAGITKKAIKKTVNACLIL